MDREALRALMWDAAGLERSAAGLEAATSVLAGWSAPEVRDRASAEDRNLLELARRTVAAALARRESVGAHCRSDEPVAQIPPAPYEEAA
jgi:L-aspartate oxidase